MPIRVYLLVRDQRIVFNAMFILHRYAYPYHYHISTEKKKQIKIYKIATVKISLDSTRPDSPSTCVNIVIRNSDYSSSQQQDLSDLVFMPFKS